MADILIRGMKMPKDSPVYLTVCPSGGVYVHTYERGYGALVKSQYRVVELPKHGDLIDRDALPKERVEWEDIDDAPVIIPSNKEKTE